jgi:hypothetical protein
MSIIIEYKKKTMRSSREKKLRHFYSLFKEGESVLDVGVSAESRRDLPAANYFLKNYRYDPRTYTGLGVQDLTGMEELFPGKRFVQYPGGKFPFSDKEFDWVFSNAVIEHVGDDGAQLAFLNEMMRVASNVFFTTPNKYFPVESHTNVLFLHWNNELFYSWCKKNKPWAKRESLYLFSFRRLQNLLKKSNATSFETYKNRTIGIPMTFTAICVDKCVSFPFNETVQN